MRRSFIGAIVDVMNYVSDVEKLLELSFRGVQRRGIRCLLASQEEQISRYARNDKGSGVVSTPGANYLLLCPGETTSRSDTKVGVLMTLNTALVIVGVLLLARSE